MTEMLQILIRSFIALTTLLIFTRAIGKQQIAQLTFFDYITGITVGSIAANLSVNLGDRPLSLWAGLISWMILIMITQFISLKSRRVHKILDGEPVVVVQNGKILEENLAKARLPVDTLMSELRTKDIFDLNELEFALMETDGKISIQKKSQHLPVTPKDLNLSTEYKGLATELIVDGQIIYENLKQVNKDITWLQTQLKQEDIKSVKEVFYAVLSSMGSLYVDKYKDELGQGQAVDISDYPGPE